MIRHALKMALRSFSRNKSTFVINIIGLSTGLACALLIVMWILDERSIDKFHDLRDRLYYVMEHQQYADNVMTTASTPGLLARTLKDEVPEIELASTLMWTMKFTLSVDDQDLNALGRYVEPDFLHMFTHPLIVGDRNKVLQDQSAVALSASVAKKLFGDAESAMGETVKLNHEKLLVVRGVFEDVPENSTQEFEILLPYEPYLEENEWLRSWGSNSPPTAVLLRAGTDPAAVDEKIAGKVKERNEQSNVTLFLKPYAERYLQGRYENGTLVGGRIEYVRLFGAIAIFILIIACINFMNLSTAYGTTRAKEVGVKKTMGITQFSLTLQYLSESVLLAMMSLGLSVVWMIFLLPTFNKLTDKTLTFPTSLSLWATFLLITLGTGLLAGSYPALYLSSFKPVEVLRGKISTSWGALLARKGLVIFQFTMSVILIIAVMVIYQQIVFVQSKNLGYAKDQLLNFSLDGKLEEEGAFFAEQLQNIPGVVNAGTIAHDLVGRQNNTSGLHWEGKQPEDRILFEHVRVGHDLLETIGVELADGRFFAREYGRDSARIIFNETAIEIMGLEEPLGKTIRLWDEYDMEIVGVVRDFHFQSLHEPVKPLFFRLAPEQTWVMMVRIAAGNTVETVQKIEEAYVNFNPGFPFEYRFVDEEYAEQYAAEQRVSRLSRYFAGLAILISCLGLLGLAAFSGERRKKEIGIRKVLGASIRQIIVLLSRDFTRLVLLAIIIGLPLAYLLLQEWLGRFEYRIPLSYGIFGIAGLILFAIAILTVAAQAWRAAMVHPHESIRDE